MDSEVAAYLEQIESRTRRARNIFVMSAAFCAFLTLHLSFLSTPGVSLGPFLLWSLTAAAYAFHLLFRAQSRLTGRVDDILAADRMKARRRLRTIKARLHGTDETAERP